MAVVVCCGAECGIVTAGLAAAANRHWSAVTGTPAIETSVVRSGSRSFRFAAAATIPYFTLTPVASQTVDYWRLYFRLTDATPTSDLSFIERDCPTEVFTIRVLTTGVMEASFNGTNPQTGPTLANDTWYGVEAEFDVSSNPHVIRWRTWDAAGGWVSRTNATRALAATTLGDGFFGVAIGPTSGTTVYVDDVIVANGTTVGQYYDTAAPKGGKVLRYVPTADGGHTFTTNDFEYNDTTGINSAATDIYSYLDDSDQTALTGPGSGTNNGFISQNVSGTGKYFQVLFGDEATETQPRCVSVTNTFHSSGTLANEANVRVSDDGVTWTNVWGDWAGVGVDVSDTSAHFRHKVLETKPSGGAWTMAAVNGMRAEMGASNDVNAVPYYDSISLEVEWSESKTPYVPVMPQLLAH